MKSKSKRLADLIEDYINLLDENIELPASIQKANEKFNDHLSGNASNIYKPKEGEDMFKIFTQIKNHEERKAEVTAEIEEVENAIKEFLEYCKGGKIAYEKKDDGNKSKINFLFWLENGMIKSNI